MLIHHQNFYIDGKDISHFIQDIDTSNTVGGRPIYYRVNQQNQQVPDDVGFIGIVNSRNITVCNTTNYDGILFSNVTNSRVETVNASIQGRYGVRLFFSSDNTLSNNTASYGAIDYNFYLQDSINNSISNNIVSNSGTGFALSSRSHSNTIMNNTASDNHYRDFYSRTSYSNKITDLTICNLTISSYPTTISFIYDAGIEIKSVTIPEYEDPAGKANIGKYVNIKDITVDSWILLSASYNDADVTNVKEASLRLYRWTGAEWEEIAGSGVNTADNYVYANVTSFSQIAAFGDPETPPTPTPAPRRGGGGGGSSGPCDTDGDGYGDIDEIIMGTDPYDPCDPDPTCIACLASIGGRVLPKPAVKPQATPKLVPTPEPVRAPTSRPAPTPVPEPEKTVIQGFETVFAIVGLLAVAYLIRIKKK